MTHDLIELKRISPVPPALLLEAEHDAIHAALPVLIEIAEDAELLYGAIDEAHDKGETFPARGSICGAKLRRSLDALRAG